MKKSRYIDHNKAYIHPLTNEICCYIAIYLIYLQQYMLYEKYDIKYGNVWYVWLCMRAAKKHCKYAVYKA